VQFWVCSQLQSQPPQTPQDAVPQVFPSVLRVHAVVSVSVELPALQVLAPHVYGVTLRVRLPELVQVEP
jgi:hypothetical protein